MYLNHYLKGKKVLVHRELIFIPLQMTISSNCYTIFPLHEKLATKNYKLFVVLRNCPSL